jgi:hypothetical protein
MWRCPCAALTFAGTCREAELTKRWYARALSAYIPAIIPKALPFRPPHRKTTEHRRANGGTDWHRPLERREDRGRMKPLRSSTFSPYDGRIGRPYGAFGQSSQMPFCRLHTALVSYPHSARTDGPPPSRAEHPPVRKNTTSQVAILALSPHTDRPHSAATAFRFPRGFGGLPRMLAFT